MYYYLAAIFFIIVIGFFACRSLFYMKKRERMVIQFPEYSALLKLHMEKAYDMIYKDQILTFSLEASRLPDKEYNISVRAFIKLVEKMLGKGLCKEFIFLYGDYDTFVFNLAEYLCKEFIFLYGDYDTFVFNLAEYFVSLYDSDAIRETAMENVMDKDVDALEGS